MKKTIAAIAIILCIIPLLFHNVAGFVVKTGNVGLVVNHINGTVDPRIRHAGFNPQMPFSGNQIVEIPTQYQTYTMVKDSAEGAHQGDDSVLVNTLSSNTLNVDTSITYHINYDPAHPEKIVDLFNKYRTQFTDFSTFEELQLRPAFRKAIVDAFGLATTAQNMTGDGKRRASAYALNELNTRFAPDSIVVDEVRVRAIYPDDPTIVALRSRLQAQQNLKLAQLNQILQGIKNQRAVLEAQAEAQAAQVRASALTPRLVKFRHLKDMNIVTVPKGAIINMSPDANPVAIEQAQQSNTNKSSDSGQSQPSDNSSPNDSN